MAARAQRSSNRAWFLNPATGRLTPSDCVCGQPDGIPTAGLRARPRRYRCTPCAYCQPRFRLWRHKKRLSKVLSR